MDGDQNLVEQLDDFDNNMMDEASINCPDDFNNGHNHHY